MPLPAPVTIATFPVEFIFLSFSAHGGKLPRPLDFAGDALRVLERAPAGGGGGAFVGEQRPADMQRELLSRIGIRLEQPAERFGREPVVGVVLFQAVLC